MEMTITLNAAERSTLKEMHSYGYYVFRQATAKRLVAMGLARVDPQDIKKVRPGHRITQKGIEALRGLK